VQTVDVIEAEGGGVAVPAGVLAGVEALPGLSGSEAARRLAARGRSQRRGSSRSYSSIVRANVLTVFNVILAAFGAVTLVFGDWRDALFLGVIVANATIGITQEVRAKRALDRLSLLVAPRARVLRDRAARPVGVDEVVVGDVVMLEPGDQLIADGELLAANDLRLDESILTGESEPADRGVGEEVRSGAFVLEGVGAYEVRAVGADSFAARLTGEARSFRHPRSPLERAVNRLLYFLVLAVLGLGAVLGYSLYHRHVGLHSAVATSTAGVVTLIPEGLMVLVSLTYAAAAVRMSRRGVLAQQLNAIESLASVDTICIDKTGTLTVATLRLVEVIAASGASEEGVRSTLGALAAGASARNLTLQTLADAYPGARPVVLGERLDVCRSGTLTRSPRSASARDGACLLSLAGRVPSQAPTRNCRRRICGRSVSSCLPKSCVRMCVARSRSCAARGST
jgi:magnesium-transporting ATPase (P-type)